VSHASEALSCRIGMIKIEYLRLGEETKFFPWTRIIVLVDGRLF
jgi:hypothetical protein